MQRKNYFLSVLVLIMSFNAYSEEALEINSQGNIQILKDLTVQQKVVVKDTIRNSTTGTTYDPLPIGTILMFDGTNWENDKTIPGWFMCDGTNNTPNLIDKFIRGSNKSGETAGNDSVKLAPKHTPVHTHNATSTSTNTVTNNYTKLEEKKITETTSVQSQNHTHDFSYKRKPDDHIKVDQDNTPDEYVEDNNQKETASGTTGDNLSDHTHDVNFTIPGYDPQVNINVSTSTTTQIESTGEPESFSILPTYYTVIYIKKIK